jgi:hypothetical protein
MTPILSPNSIDAAAQRAIEHRTGHDRKQVSRPGRLA